MLSQLIAFDRSHFWPPLLERGSLSIPRSNARNRARDFLRRVGKNWHVCSTFCLRFSQTSARGDQSRDLIPRKFREPPKILWTHNAKRGNMLLPFVGGSTLVVRARSVVLLSSRAFNHMKKNIFVSRRKMHFMTLNAHYKLPNYE